MRGTAAAGNAHAKTGTLNIAVCLSGYVKSANDRRVAFSILVNGGSVSLGRAAAAQDAIVVALAEGQPAGLAPVPVHSSRYVTSPSRPWRPFTRSAASSSPSSSHSSTASAEAPTRSATSALLSPNRLST